MRLQSPENGNSSENLAKVSSQYRRSSRFRETFGGAVPAPADSRAELDNHDAMSGVGCSQLRQREALTKPGIFAIVECRKLGASRFLAPHLAAADGKGRSQLSHSHSERA